MAPPTDQLCYICLDDEPSLNRQLVCGHICSCTNLAVHVHPCLESLVNSSLVAHSSVSQRMTCTVCKERYSLPFRLDSVYEPISLSWTPSVQHPIPTSSARRLQGTVQYHGPFRNRSQRPLYKRCPLHLIGAGAFVFSASAMSTYIAISDLEDATFFVLLLAACVAAIIGFRLVASYALMDGLDEEGTLVPLGFRNTSPSTSVASASQALRTQPLHSRAAVNHHVVHIRILPPRAVGQTTPLVFPAAVSCPHADSVVSPMVPTETGILCPQLP